MTDNNDGEERKFRFFKTRRGMILASLEPYDMPCDFTREPSTKEEMAEAKKANPTQKKGPWEIEDTIVEEVATAHG